MYQQKAVALGEFIKQYRNKVNPESCGLTVKRRRRVNGLRREELAELCGISTTWINWIEQGRAKSLSPVTLDTLAKALKLNSEERAYTFMLANLYDPYFTKNVSHCNNSVALAKQVIDGFDYPGFITNKNLDILESNKSAKNVFENMYFPNLSFGNNLIVQTFLNPLIRIRIGNWQSFSTKIIAKLRFNTANVICNKELENMISYLKNESLDFCKTWENHEVLASNLGVVEINNEQSKVFTFFCKSFVLDSDNNLSMNFLIPG